MKITRNSKTVWTVNGMRIDTRQAVKHRPKFAAEREALMVYFERRNPRLNWIKIDARICGLINRNLKQFEALRSQTVFAK